MKCHRTFKLIGSFLLMGILLGGYQASAAHSQRALHGVIQTVNYAADSFTIVSDKGKTTNAFIWNAGTSFRQKSPQPGVSWISRLFSLGEKTTADSLKPGRSVQIYYRREYGRSVAHWVTVLLPAPNRPAAH